MNITPERALELAGKLASREIRLSVFDSFTLSNLMDADRDLESILRHYAEIAPKWQTVLDAEPVATVRGHFHPVPEGVSFSSKDWDRLYALQVGTQLIIKPAP